MAPPIFASVRSRSRPNLLGPFRDDSSLVAFRYEKTAQAEPPTPLPPRSPTLSSPKGRSLRAVASDLSSRTTLPPASPRGLATSLSSTAAGLSPSSFAELVVVSPPASPTPPREIHPALRESPSFTPSPRGSLTPATTATTVTPRTRSSVVSDCDAWKRDSGAPTTSSATSTKADDYYCHFDDPLYDKLRECGVLVAPAPGSGYSTDDDVTTTPAQHSPSDTQTHPAHLEGYQLDRYPAPHFAGETTSIETTPLPADAPPSASPAASPRSRLAKSFSSKTSLGIAAARKLRRRSGSNQTISSVSSASSAAFSALATAMSVRLQGELAGASTRTTTPPPPTKTSPKSPNLSPASAPARLDLSLSSTPVADPNFSPLSIAIPDDRLLEDDFMTNLSFSKRGSVMFGGQRAVSQPDTTSQQRPLVPDALPIPVADDTTATPSSPPETDLTAASPATAPAAGAMAPTAANVACDKRNSDASVGETAIDRTSQATTAAPSIRVMSADVEKDSHKVRLLYDSGDVTTWEEEKRLSPLGEQIEPAAGQASTEDVENDRVPELQPSVWASPRSTSSLSTRHDASFRREHELAGGIEDWEDVNGADVDRYGFISPRRPESRAGTPTELKSAQFAPRRRNVLIKRDLSGLSSSQLSARSPSRKVSARSLNTQNSERSVRSRRSTRSAIRQASNYLPHNRNRRWMDEAGDMLTMAPGLQDMLEDARIEKISEAIKKKETERSEKWRKMAKVVKRGKDGEGMEFEFDVKNPKLIERTWKGIPDRWRASAWYSFLATSAKNRAGSATEEQIMADFHRFQQANSPDDVQIDLDVPRTINRHIMFRRRYRGGQRLLFRVLHALSLYFPDVGYVQGMASLAATLLCYFDEERCFVMLVRMWQYRGLEQLYQPGFEGLMAALKELETDWLGGKEMAKKMTELCIDATAYGTRWYLTLFNLSIPFQAQLRVWDVFLLLGDQSGRPSTSQEGPKADEKHVAGIDVVHATSAALIDALGEVLLDSDFENAMKALTSWIPIKDEDLLMKVTKAEWKAHQGKKKA